MAIISFRSFSNPNGGQCVPTIFSVGLLLLRTSAALTAVPGLPPSRKTDRPFAAALRLSDEIKSEPAMRCGRGVRCNRLAQISGIPSGTTSSASATERREAQVASRPTHVIEIRRDHRPALTRVQLAQNVIDASFAR